MATLLLFSLLLQSCSGAGVGHGMDGKDQKIRHGAKRQKTEDRLPASVVSVSSSFMPQPTAKAGNNPTQKATKSSGSATSTLPTGQADLRERLKTASQLFTNKNHEDKSQRLQGVITYSENDAEAPYLKLLQSGRAPWAPKKQPKRCSGAGVGHGMDGRKRQKTNSEPLGALVSVSSSSSTTSQAYPVTDLEQQNADLRKLRQEHKELKKELAALEKENEAKIALIRPAPNSSFSPLDLACMQGDLEWVRRLLKGNADVNSAGPLFSPLNTACTNGNSALAQLLLDAKANIEERDEFGDNALHWALEEDKDGIVPLLIRAKADVNCMSERERRPLHIVCESRSENTVVTQLLLDAKAYVDPKDESHTTPLMLASSHGSIKIMKVLLKRGANVSTKNDNGDTSFSVLLKDCQDYRDIPAMCPYINLLLQYGFMKENQSIAFNANESLPLSRMLDNRYIAPILQERHHPTNPCLESSCYKTENNWTHNSPISLAYLSTNNKALLLLKLFNADDITHRVLAEHKLAELARSKFIDLSKKINLLRKIVDISKALIRLVAEYVGFHPAFSEYLNLSGSLQLRELHQMFQRVFEQKEIAARPASAASSSSSSSSSSQGGCK